MTKLTKTKLSKIIENFFFILACLLLAWIAISFLATLPYVEDKPDQPWSFFEVLLKIGEKFQAWKGGK